MPSMSTSRTVTAKSAPTRLERYMYKSDNDFGRSPLLRTALTLCANSRSVAGSTVASTYADTDLPASAARRLSATFCSGLIRIWS